MEGESVGLIIGRLVPGFETSLFEAALKNLEDRTNPLRFNNFAYSVRELVRHIFSRLAPDREVVQCVWYTNLTPKPNGVTRKQRGQYAVQGGLSDAYVKATLGLNADADHKALTSAIDDLSKFTHIKPETLDIPQAQIEQRAQETLAAVASVLRTVGDCRDRLVGQLEEEIDAATVDEVLGDPLAGIDELASHYSLEDVSVSSVTVTSIDHEFIYLTAEGMVDCILQFGSNSDVRRGEGAEVPQSFAFTCRLFSPVADPTDLTVVEDSIGVDTEEWQRARYGADEYD